MVLEKRALVDIERQEVVDVAEVTSHDFGRKKDGLAPIQSPGEKAGYSAIW